MDKQPYYSNGNRRKKPGGYYTSQSKGQSSNHYNSGEYVMKSDSTTQQPEEVNCQPKTENYSSKDAKYTDDYYDEYQEYDDGSYSKKYYNGYSKNDYYDYYDYDEHDYKAQPTKTGYSYKKKDGYHKETTGGPSNNKNKFQTKKQYKQVPDNRVQVEKTLPDVCLVCLGSIALNSKIWVCKTCQIITHLKCIKDWLDLKKKNAKSNIDEEISFNCPHCSFKYANEDPKHTCYCTKTFNPVADTFNEPNSCGKLCGRFKGRYCSHACERICHSDKCDPCDKLTSLKCYCGKNTLTLKCNEAVVSASLACSKVCGKLLNCGNHTCNDLCHDGDCQNCDIKVHKSCHCGKKKAIVDCSQDFSCEKSCSRILSCGNHYCKLICHEGDCEKCKTEVRPKEKCYCQRHSVERLLGRLRENCLEEIPSCNTTCGRRLPCGHSCILNCHEGECDCRLIVERVCECGSHKFDTKCMHINQPQCKTICNKFKDCQRHICSAICCKGRLVKKNYPPHICKMLCDKNLQCGKHTCTKKCHSGKCPPCDVLVSRAITCACGSEVLRPPQLCGTEPPKCNKRCNKQLRCGHKCYYECHFDECRECEELVDKPCACGKEIIKQVKCSKFPKCHTLCKEILGCGHECNQNCHEPGLCNKIRKEKMQKFLDDETISSVEKDFFKENDLLEKSCFAKCSEIRKDCHHLCLSFCHQGVECPPLFCKFMTRVTCECGNKEEFRQCGTLDINNHKILECDEKCKNLLRFKALYDVQETTEKLYFSISLVNYSKAHPKLLNKIETAIEKMYFNVEKHTSFTISKVSEEKLNFYIQLLQNHYLLNVSYYRTEKNICIDAFRTDEFIIPKVKLSQYLKMLKKKEIKPKSKPFDLIFKFYNLSVFDKPDNLEEILKPLKDKYYIEKVNNMIQLAVWRINDKDLFVEKLAELNNNWSSFSVEDRTKPKNTDRLKSISLIPETQDYSDDDIEKRFEGLKVVMPSNIALPIKSKKKHLDDARNTFNVFHNEH